MSEMKVGDVVKRVGRTSLSNPAMVRGKIYTIEKVMESPWGESDPPAYILTLKGVAGMWSSLRFVKVSVKLENK